MVHDLTKTWDLVHKAKGGDAEALDRLFARYYEKVRRAVRARIGHQLRARLETADILQSAFARAFVNFDRFEMRTEGSLLHWLAEYAQGQVRDAADEQNAAKRRPPGGLVDIDAKVDGRPTIELPASGAEPGESAANAELDRAIERCLDELPEHYRNVIVLRDYDGLEWSEVATRLAKNTESAARELHRRATHELAARLRQRGIGPG